MKLLSAILGVTGLSTVLGDDDDAPGQKTSITGQIFCDNFCKVYYNGEEILNDEASGRTVETVTFEADRTGTRTFAAMLLDNPYQINNGIWQFGNPAYLNDGELSNLFCLGDGGFKAIFTDDTCGEIVVSGADWKCEAVRTGPLDAEACFENGFVNDPTYQNPVERGDPENGGLRLYDPCIENPGDVEILDSCEELVISDYDQNWVVSGYDDSDWKSATTFTLDEALPKRGRPANYDLYADCTGTNWYCDPSYPESSWGDADFIWSEDLELDNVVLCRYEYNVDKCLGSD